MTNLVKQESREEVVATVQAVTHLVAEDLAASLMRFSVETHHLVVEEVNVKRLAHSVGQI